MYIVPTDTVPITVLETAYLETLRYNLRKLAIYFVFESPAGLLTTKSIATVKKRPLLP